MPFIANPRRQEIEKLGLTACQDVGDICCVFYTHLVGAWKLEPRWKTAHRLYRDLVLDDSDANLFFWHVCDTLQYKFELADIRTALELAWQVFFHEYVMVYEKQKEAEHGTI